MAPAHFLLMNPISFPPASFILKFQAFQSPEISPINSSDAFKMVKRGFKK
jgi:hypothetical protein